MKNIVSIDTENKCGCCNQKGFFTVEKCPLCLNTILYDEKYDIFEEDDNRYLYDFCTKCRIVFSDGCKHREIGCCDGVVYNCHFISKYEYEGEIYEGMPLFENEEEWLSEAGKIKVLETVCPNKGIICKDNYSALSAFISSCSLSS